MPPTATLSPVYNAPSTHEHAGMKLEALNTAGVRYLVVGGLAVNAHGYLRYTKNVDIVVRLTSPDIVSAFAALRGIDYFPSVPITAEQFADPAMREGWRQEKRMLVLKFWSDAHRETPLDVFVYHPFDFDLEYARAMVGGGADDPPARFVAIPALIAMKREAGRARDLNRHRQFGSYPGVEQQWKLEPAIRREWVGSSALPKDPNGPN